MADTQSQTPFARWLEETGHTLVDAQIATRLGYATLIAAKKGRAMRYGTAKTLSEYTKGAVSIAELCEPASASADSSGPHEQQAAEPADAAE